MIQKSNGHQIFGGRQLVIATMHQKEKVIAPLLEKELGVKCFTLPDLNTDVFGTFSGEVARENSPLETARLKAHLALKLCDATLAIASEGSFGNHPSSGFISANEELVVLIDTENQLEIIGRFLTTETNLHQQEIKSLSDFETFKKTVGYPTHRVILKIENLESGEKLIYKEVKFNQTLEDLISKGLAQNSKITSETDMRAMHNPTRMLAIGKATQELIKNCNSFCPKCNNPGYRIHSSLPGLPCALCRFPTKSIQSYRYRCQKCDYSIDVLKQGKEFEDPTYCDNCNP